MNPIWLIPIFTIIGIIVGLIVYKPYEGNGGLAWFCILVGVVIGCVSFILIDDACGSGRPQIRTNHALNSYPLIAGKVRQGIKGNIAGSLLFVVGSMESELSYVYYIRMPNGGIQAKKRCVSDSVSIFEENRKDGVFEERETVEIKTFCGKWWIFKINSVSMETKERHYEFHIPEGSIKRELDFDL